jgi:Bacterial extracellular solute-binding protein
MRTRSKIIFVAIIILALGIVGVSILLNLSKGPSTGLALTVDKPSTVNIRILSALPVEAWVREEADKYNSEGHKVQGATVQVEIVTMDGLIALNNWDKDTFGSLPADADPLKLTDQQKKALETFPTAWIADSRYLVELANVPYKTRLGRDVFLTDGEYRAKPLAISPLVWGIYNSRAEVLKKKYQTINWHTIHDAAMAKGGWAELGGDPAWGFFKPVIPNPQKNIGGLGAMVSAAGEYFNTTRIDASSVGDPGFQAWLLELMKAITGLGVSSYSVEDFALFGYSVGDGGLLLESDLLQNMQGMQNRWEDSMNITYPEFLTWYDFPYAIWVGPETTALQKNAAIDFEQYLLSDPQQKRALVYGLRPANPNVKVDAIPDSLFVKWANQGVLPVVPRSTSMRSPDRDILTALLRWYDLNVVQ